MAYAPGGYRRLRRLGRGASGDVWEVHAPQSGERLALKEMNFSGMTKQERELVLQEARLLRRLSHPHIVRFVDLVVEDIFVCIVMQYIDGGDMRSLLAKRREARDPLPEADIWQWLLQIASALLYLHKAKILHRDVKPANIFLTAHSQSAVLGDLGIAKVLANTEARAVTQIGTPGYLAPEVWLGQRYSYAADVYSLGCTVYELAELRMPFIANDRALLAAQACHRRCTPISNTSYSRPLRSLVQFMLDKDPLLRPGPAQILLYAEQVSQSGARNGGMRDQPATRPPAVRNNGANPGARGAGAAPAAGLPSDRRRSPLRRRALSPSGVDLGGARGSPDALPSVAASPSAGRLSPLQRRPSPVTSGGNPGGCAEPPSAAAAAPSAERRASPLRRRFSPPPMPGGGIAAAACAEVAPPLPWERRARAKPDREVSPPPPAVPPLPFERQARSQVSPPPPPAPAGGKSGSRSPRSGLRITAAIDSAPGCREGAPLLRVRPCPAPAAATPPNNEQQQHREPLIGTRPGTRDRGRSAPRGHAPRSPRQRSAGNAPRAAMGSPAPPGTALGGPSRSRSPGLPPRAPTLVGRSAQRAPAVAPDKPTEHARASAVVPNTGTPGAAVGTGGADTPGSLKERSPKDIPEAAGWGSVVPWKDRVDMSTFLAETSEEPLAQELGAEQNAQELYEPTLLFDEVLKEIQLSGEGRSHQAPAKHNLTPTAELSALASSQSKGHAVEADLENAPEPGAPADIESTLMLLRSVLQALPDECN